MGDPKRDKPKDRKDEKTAPDRGAPLPSITAPRFGGTTDRPPPEVSVSVTTPGPGPGEEERTDTTVPKMAPKAELDPSAYASDVADELASEFQGGGKELDAGGRLVSQQPEPAPLPSEDVPITDVSNAGASAPARGLARLKRLTSRNPKATRPPAPAAEPPVKQVEGKRSQPGRWVLNREGPAAAAAPAPDPDSFAFDPTVRRAAPQPPSPPSPSPGRRRIPRIAIGAGAGVVLAAIAAGVWSARPPPEPPAPVTPASPPAPALQTPWLKITSRPSGAAVRVNGVSLGSTPIDRESPFAPEAELEVEVTLKGYRAWTRKFPSGQNVTTHAQLKPGR